MGRLIALALAVLASTVQPAHASPPVIDCGYEAVAQRRVTGGRETFTGVMYGYAAAEAPGAALSVRCYVAVDGVEVATTPTGTGRAAAATAGQVTFTATETQQVDVCGEWSSGTEGGTACWVCACAQIPPQEVLDVVDQVVGEHLPVPLPAAACDELPARLPHSQLAYVAASGDVWVAGLHVFDC